jgi:hypothetical protein
LIKAGRYFYFITGYRRDAEITGPDKVLPSTPSMGIAKEKSENNNYSCEPTWDELDLEVQRQYIWSSQINKPADNDPR